MAGPRDRVEALSPGPGLPEIKEKSGIWNLESNLYVPTLKIHELESRYDDPCIRDTYMGHPDTSIRRYVGGPYAETRIVIS